MIPAHAPTQLGGSALGLGVANHQSGTPEMGADTPAPAEPEAAVVSS